MSKTNPLFQNPWPNLQHGSPPLCRKLNATVPTEIINSLTLYRFGMSDGTIQTTINLFLCKLLNELHSRNAEPLTEHGTFTFESLVANSRLYIEGESLPPLLTAPVLNGSGLAIPGSPHSSPNPATPVVDVGSGPSSPPLDNPSEPGEQPDLKGRTPSRSGGKRAAKQAGKKAFDELKAEA